MNYFFDAHCHVMTLQHPNLMTFLNSMDSYLPDFLTSGTFSPTYVLGGKNRYLPAMIGKVNNTLRAFNGPVSKILQLMQDDLSGAFLVRKKETPYPEQPFYRDGKFFFRGKSYDRVALCPLLMDFTETSGSTNDTNYYPAPKEDKIIRYAEDTVEGIESYYSTTKNHLFDIFPLIGITPSAHPLKEIEKMLETYVATDHKIVREGPTKKRFYGLKFYPPLGFDAWPKSKEERKKVEMMYEFCTTYKLPAITHCDDQGFRVMPSKRAWELTEPNHYIPALERYPELKLDFAHFGYRYSIQGTTLQSLAAIRSGFPASPWFSQITDMIDIYPNVYGDFSFAGTNPLFYKEVQTYLQAQDEQKGEKLRSRMLFGSDFSINLFKVESYTQYYEIFQESPFSDDDIDLFAKRNPMEFLALKEEDTVSETHLA